MQLVYYGGLDAGIDQFICVVGDEAGRIVVREKIETGDPQRTMTQVFRFFANFKLAALGAGVFSTSAATSRLMDGAWDDYPFTEQLTHNVRIPVSMTWQINAAAFGELRQGAARGLDGCLYLAIDRVIHAGLIRDHRFLNGLPHSTIGRLLLNRHPKDRFDTWRSCLNDLATLPSIEERWKRPLRSLPPDHIAWEIEADYLAQCVLAYTLIAAPRRILVTMANSEQQRVLPLIRARLKTLLAGDDCFSSGESLADYVTAPELGEKARLVGALELARAAFEKGRVECLSTVNR